MFIHHLARAAPDQFRTLRAPRRINSDVDTPSSCAARKIRAKLRLKLNVQANVRCHACICACVANSSATH
jgi:hypothetical protein